MNAVDSMAWRSRANAKKFAVPVRIKYGDLGLEVVQGGLNDSFTGLAGRQTFAGVPELPECFSRYGLTESHGIWEDKAYLSALSTQLLKQTQRD